MSGERVLVVDDDVNISKMLQAFLRSQKMEVTVCHEAMSALQTLDHHEVDVVLLDVMMPGLSGLDALPLIHRRSDAPVILLTARDMLEDKIKGFEAGADDYIVKPFAMEEVLMRIRARIKGRPSTEAEESPSLPLSSIVKVGEVSVEMERYRVSVGSRVIENMKPREIQLLYFLATNPNKVFNRSQILDHVWGADAFVDDRTVDAHIKSIRKHLGAQGNMIKTVWGVGYKLEPEE